MAEKKSMSSSPLYKSTLDDLVVEDKALNVVSSTENLEVFFLCSLSLSFSLSSILLSVIHFDCPCRRKLKSMACTSQQTREVSELEPPAHLWRLCSPGGDLGYVYLKGSITGS